MPQNYKVLTEDQLDKAFVTTDRVSNVILIHSWAVPPRWVSPGLPDVR